MALLDAKAQLVGLGGFEPPTQPRPVRAIIVTAALVAERGHVEDAGSAIALLLGTALVLLIAHTYSSVMAA